MPLSQSGRLLCASANAYAIKTSGLVPATLPPPNPPRSALVGYRTVSGCASGVDVIDAGLVGVTDDAIVVAFRGTLPITSSDFGQALVDWANDADAPLVNDKGLPGRVHTGFRDTLNDLWPEMEPLLAGVIAAEPNKPIWVTGHSKGGAVAPIAAMRIAATWPGAQISVRTFAGARCGDLDFATAYAARIPDSLRYEFADDIVPHLPPSPAFLVELAKLPLIGEQFAALTPNYVSVGELQYIPARAAPGAPPLPDSPALEATRIQSLINLLSGFQFKTIAGDHSIDIDSGYAGAVCPGF